ncbi:MAG: hypothetical protein M3N24_10310 [Actinomycetota bacterium]|nr:hypothetical protein [Actinomycetota bacterium]
MSGLAWGVIAVGVLVLLLVAFAFTRRQKSTGLRRRFGPEYDRAVAQEGRRSGEKQLRERLERREGFQIRELPEDARASYLESWRHVQERFVDRPADAISEADRLVQRVMRDRGYPTDGFEEQAANISVDHPQVVAHYRAAHRTAEASSRGEAETENLRQAMLHYRNLFETLLGKEAATSS